MEERFKHIMYEGHETKFYITDMGHVYDECINEIPLRYDSRGYVYVTLYQKFLDGLILNQRIHVHRLVAEAFIPNPYNLPTVNHLHVETDENGNSYAVKDDNRYFMLEWSSYSENNQHAVDTGLRVPLRCEKHQNATLTNKQVIKVCERLQDGQTYEKIITDLHLENIPNIKRKLIMIKTGNAWKEIADNYTFSKIKRRESKYTEQDIHSICKLLESGRRDYGNMLDELGLENNRNARSLLSQIKNRRKYTVISKNYKW